MSKVQMDLSPPWVRRVSSCELAPGLSLVV